MFRMLMILGVVFSLLFTHSADAYATGSNPYQIYQVKAGDSLWKISHHYKISIEELKRINGLNNNIIQIGQKLKMPAISIAGQDRYVVQKGDNLWKIAQMFNSDVTSIKEFNRLRSSTLQIGQVLIVPDDDSSSFARKSSIQSVLAALNVSLKEFRPSLGPSIEKGTIETVTYSAKKKDTLKVASVNKSRNEKVAYTPQEYEWLATLIEAEAEDEPYLGKVGVGSVVMNRLEHKWFPNTIKEIIFQRTKHVYQFSPVGDGRFYRVKPSKESYKAATAALRGEDPTKGALYFFNPRISTDDWIRTRTVAVEIGNHNFAY